jgi:hypothetical protein
MDNIPKTGIEGLLVMKPPKAETKNAGLKQQQEEKERKQRLENAKKARAMADNLFPDEKWKSIDENVYLSPHRKKGSSFEDEVKDAKIL